MTKKFLTVLITGMLMLSVAGGAIFAQGQEEGEKTYRVGAAVYGLQGEYMRLWTTALERHPDVQSGMVEITVFDGNYDASRQISQFETMVSQQYDAILFVPIDIEAGAAAVEAAFAADIPVVGSNTRVNSDNLTSYIGSNDVLSGYMEASAVIEAMGGEGNVVIIEGPIGQSAQIERREGNLKAIAEYPDVEVIEMKTANWSRAEAMNVMENWLSAHPGEIDGIIGQNDEMALGAIQAVKDNGFDPRDFPTAGIDGVTDAMLAVKSGELAKSILQNAVGQAQGALDLALRSVIGEDYEPKAACWEEMEWGSSIQDNYNVPWVPITLENVDDLLAERETLTIRD